MRRRDDGPFRDDQLRIVPANEASWDDLAAIFGTADYPALKRILLDRPGHMEGVDYALLGDRLRAADMPARELQWARDVARVHVFLEQWR